jgi:glycosyltransferase involved in cell wall biosynthesis
MMSNCGCGIVRARQVPPRFRHPTAPHAFLCLSEHEGFCIPLLEAFHGVPVNARPVGGVPEVAGNAAFAPEPTARALRAAVESLAR